MDTPNITIIKGDGSRVVIDIDLETKIVVEMNKGDMSPELAQYATSVQAVGGGGVAVNNGTGERVQNSSGTYTPAVHVLLPGELEVRTYTGSDVSDIARKVLKDRQAIKQSGVIFVRVPGVGTAVADWLNANSSYPVAK